MGDSIPKKRVRNIDIFLSDQCNMEKYVILDPVNGTSLQTWENTRAEFLAVYLVVGESYGKEFVIVVVSRNLQTSSN